MKRLITILLICMFIIKIPVFAEPDNISVVVDGTYLSFDQPPVMQSDRVLVPLRAIFEALDATVEWNDETQTVTSTKGNTTVSMQINNTQYSVNTEQKTMDVPPLLLNSRTLIPVRAVAESFGCNVDWDDANQTVIIDSNIKIVTIERNISETLDEGIFSVSADYPELVCENDSVDIETINRKIKDSLTGEIETLKGYYDNHGANVAYNYEYGVPNITNNLFAVLYTVSCHSNTLDTYVYQYAEVYKLNTGERATLTDYFPGKSYEEIIAMIITDFYSVILSEPEEYYEDAVDRVEMYIDDAVVYPCGNEIAVTFNPGVIAPYELGFKTLTYPAEY